MKMDAFALLGLPRRASMNADDVRAAFQRTGSQSHPDGAGDVAERTQRTADFAALNEAYAVLGSLPRRLRHLLELEYPDTAATKTGVVMDGAMMDLFSITGAAVQAATTVQAKRQKAATAIARAMLAADEMLAQEALESAARLVEAARAALETEIEELDRLREAGVNVAARLQSCAARAGFLEKWQAQLRAAFAGFFAA